MQLVTDRSGTSRRLVPDRSEPVIDWSPSFADRSATSPRSVGDRSATSPTGRKMFCNWSATGPRSVGDRSGTSHRLVADQLQIVATRSPIGPGAVGDWSPIGRRPVAKRPIGDLVKTSPIITKFDRGEVADWLQLCVIEAIL